MFNAPWPALLIAVVIPLTYLLQTRVPEARQEELFYTYGLIPQALEAGAWHGLVTSQFLHGNWAHALLNAVGALAFGAPAARLLGLSFPRAAAFFAFYIVCGVTAGWAFALLHPGELVVLAGASGAVSGLMGAAARLLERRGRLGPFFSRTVIAMTIAWVAVNLMVGLTGFAPGSGGAPVAWEAHIAGYAAGLLLIGPWAALFGKRWRRPPAYEETDPPELIRGPE